MIVYDGYRIGASNYYELRGFMEKHGFNPSQIVSESDRFWRYRDWDGSQEHWIG